MRALACALAALLVACSTTENVTNVLGAIEPDASSSASSDASPAADSDGSTTPGPDAASPTTTDAGDAGTAPDADDAATVADAGGPDSAGGWFCEEQGGYLYPFCTPGFSIACAAPDGTIDVDAAPACPPPAAGPCPRPTPNVSAGCALYYDFQTGTPAPYPSDAGAWFIGSSTQH